VELEGVLREGENADDGVAEAHDLMHRLRVDATQLVGGRTSTCCAPRPNAGSG
jgi:hypothetical protein